MRNVSLGQGPCDRLNDLVVDLLIVRQSLSAGATLVLVVGWIMVLGPKPTALTSRRPTHQ